MLVGRKGRRSVEALFDTGASHSLLREEIADAIGEPEDLPEPVHFEAAVGSFVAKKGVFADVILNGKRFPSSLRLVPGLTQDLILGTDFLQMWHIRLDPRKRRVILDPKALRFIAIGGWRARQRS